MTTDERTSPAPSTLAAFSAKPSLQKNPIYIELDRIEARIVGTPFEIEKPTFRTRKISDLQEAEYNLYYGIRRAIAKFVGLDALGLYTIMEDHAGPLKGFKCWAVVSTLCKECHIRDRHTMHDILRTLDRKSTRLNSSHVLRSRMPSSA